MENNEINFNDLNADTINNLIGETKVIPEYTYSLDSGINSGLTVDISREVSLIDPKVSYSLNIPKDVIQFALNEGVEDKSTVIINEEFVRNYFEAEQLYNSIAEQLSNAKEILKEFIETNNTGSISSNGMEIKYSPATTTTTIDSTKLKSEFPDIAAKCSKVSARKSSISIKEAK